MASGINSLFLRKPTPDMRKIVLAVLLPVLCLSCRPQQGYVTLTGYAQGGTYTVKANLDGVSLRSDAVHEGIERILHQVDTTLSGYNKGSVLSRFNRGESDGDDPLFREMFALSRRFYEETGGALDVAAGPLFDAWGFGFTTDSLPSAEKVDSLRAVCGMHVLDAGMRPVVPGVQPRLNFNAVAQGYTCDLVAGYLHSLGVKDMLVDIGEIYCEGVGESGRPWRIGVDRPEDGNMVPGAALSGVWQGDGRGCGVVTSGNYRKFYVKDGKKYSHTVDPRTGWPVTHSLLSATIVAKDAVSADAYATFCMVVGLQEAKAFILSREDLEGFLIYDEQGRMAEWTSPGFNLAD